MRKETPKSNKDRSAIQSSEPQPTDATGDSQQPLQLLIVEDYEGFRESLRLYFEYFGYQVRVADSYNAAIKEAQLSPPDVLICDWNINGRRDGTEVAREIHTRYGSIIVFVSASSMTRLREATRDLSAAHYFRKPASPSQIAKLIKSVEQGLLGPPQ